MTGSVGPSLTEPGASFEVFVAELQEADLAVDLALLRTVDSTNRLALEIAAELRRDQISVASTAFIGWEQTAGRGRQGRSWWSPGGTGIYVSMLLEWTDRSQVDLLPLRVPLALVRSLTPYLEQPCMLDWPNDLLMGGRKLGGVLIESRSEGEREGGVVVVGFGLNYREHPGTEVRLGATSVEVGAGGDGSALPSLGVLTAEIVNAVHASVLLPMDPETVVREYAEHSLHRPGDVLRCRVGQREIEGSFLGFGKRGYLRLLVDGREEAISSGEIIES